MKRVRSITSESKVWGCECAGYVQRDEGTWLLVEELLQGCLVWVHKDRVIVDDDSTDALMGFRP